MNVKYLKLMESVPYKLARFTEILIKTLLIRISTGGQGRRLDSVSNLL